ncbi:hypothetical protein BT69DRAFT_906807 [Atractiella rhizophila]|nr:hypothetical protein BT69DRAFT_906807 [Atractiella rhizophila]
MVTRRSVKAKANEFSVSHPKRTATGSSFRLLRLRNQSLVHHLRTSSIVSRSPSPPPFLLSRSELAVSFMQSHASPPHISGVSLVSFGSSLLLSTLSPQLSPTVPYCRWTLPRLRVMESVRTEILGQLVTEQARLGEEAQGGETVAEVCQW